MAIKHGYVTIPEAAKLAQVSPNTMRQRLLLLQKDHPAILQSFTPNTALRGKPGRLYVSTRELRRAMPELHGVELEALEAVRLVRREYRKELRKVKKIIEVMGASILQLEAAVSGLTKRSESLKIGQSEPQVK